MAQDNRDYKGQPPPTPPARKAASNVTPIRGPMPHEESAHDPSIDYQPPNPHLVMAPPNITKKLFGLVVALILAAGVIWLMFHNWMRPGPRQPGGQQSSPGLQQRVP